MKKLLAAVAIVLGLVVAADAAVLTWTDNSDNESGFRVYRKADGCASSAAWVVIAGAPANATSYVDTTAVQGQTYCYALTAYNNSGESAQSNAVNFTVPFTVPLSPSNLVVNP